MKHLLCQLTWCWTLLGTPEEKWASLPGSGLLSVLIPVVLGGCVGETMMELTLASSIDAQVVSPGPAQKHPCHQLPGSFPRTAICGPASFPSGSTALSFGSFPVNFINSLSKWFLLASDSWFPCGISWLSVLVCDSQPVTHGPALTWGNPAKHYIIQGLPPPQGGLGPALRSPAFQVHAFLGYSFSALGYSSEVSYSHLINN